MIRLLHLETIRTWIRKITSGIIGWLAYRVLDTVFVIIRVSQVQFRYFDKCIYDQLETLFMSAAHSETFGKFFGAIWATEYQVMKYLQFLKNVEKL